MDIKYTQCDICKKEAERPYKLIIEPKNENCSYATNKIDICEDCLSCISNLSIPNGYNSSIKLSMLLRSKHSY